MKVSVIMCSYNSGAYIERAIESIISQTYTNWELVISDDASTDNTRELIRNYLSDSRIKLVKHKSNVGYLLNKNRAFGYASGALLTQLDADDTSPATRLEKQVNVFLDHKNIMICGTNYQLVDVNDHVFYYKEYPSDFLVEPNSDEFPFWFPGLMFRKEVLDEFGLFSEYFIGSYGDDEYWTYKVNAKYPVYFIHEYLYCYRKSPHSVTGMLDNPRKLIAAEILIELRRQRNATGTDYLETNQLQKMKDFENSLLTNKKLLAEKYSIWAAKAIDNKDFPNAKQLLSKSFRNSISNINNYRALLYYFRSKLSKQS